MLVEPSRVKERIPPVHIHTTVTSPVHTSQVGETLELEPELKEVSFMEHGIDSEHAVSFVDRLNERLG